jgi:hypothetical protein
MALIHGKLLLPISILQTLVENCGVKFIAKYNNLYIKYAGVVGITEGTFFGGGNYEKNFSGVFNDKVYETVYVTGFIEHIEGSELESTLTNSFHPRFKLCKFSNVKNIPYEPIPKHELLLTANLEDIPLPELYYCNIEEYLDWLGSLGQEVRINDTGLYIFINKILELMPECSEPNSTSAKKLAHVFHDLWGIDAERVLKKHTHEITSKDEKTTIFPPITVDDTKIIHAENKIDNNSYIPETNLTPLISILIEAIHQHFPEGREIDPKKASVVEWILEKAKKEGITESKNIADAIFTIIKPLNHNPKKRKG